MKLSDFKGLFSKSELSVVSVENPHSDYFVVTMKSDSDLNWRPGEHGIFTLPNHPVDGKKYRAFSIASITEEDHVLIGTRTGENPSSFKHFLTHLKSGEKVKITGPFGWFTLQDETTPLVLITGGVGVTPVRALLKELEKSNHRNVDVIYGSQGYYLFEEELLQIAEKDSKLNLHFVESIKETRDKIKEFAKHNGNNAYYYISGTAGMIKTTKKLLKEYRIQPKRIINDPFLGY